MAELDPEGGAAGRWEICWLVWRELEWSGLAEQHTGGSTRHSPPQTSAPQSLETRPESLRVQKSLDWIKYVTCFYLNFFILKCFLSYSALCEVWLKGKNSNKQRLSDSVLPSSLFATSRKDSKKLMETASPGGENEKSNVHCMSHMRPARAKRRESLSYIEGRRTPPSGCFLRAHRWSCQSWFGWLTPSPLTWCVFQIALLQLHRPTCELYMRTRTDTDTHTQASKNKRQRVIFSSFLILLRCYSVLRELISPWT